MAISISLVGLDELPRLGLVQQKFHFEVAWIRAPDYMETVERAWEEGRASVAPSLQNTCDNLHCLTGSLQCWSTDSFGLVRKKIRKLEGKLKDLHLTNANITEARLVEKELCELFERKEIMARHCARVDWLREWDRNTAFFHAKATARKRAN
jgi:hypothetical protein